MDRIQMFSSLPEGFPEGSHWLQCGGVLQYDSHHFVIGEGPFQEASGEGQPAFYHSDFFLERKHPWRIPHRMFRVSRKELEEALLNQNGSSSLIQKLNCKSKTDISDFKKVFHRVHTKIVNKDFEKVVLTSFDDFASDFNLEQSLLCALKNIKDVPEQGFLYGMWGKDKGILGWTPEILFQVNKNNFQTMALAGTQKNTKEGSLLKDAKELKEQNLVKKEIERVLKKLGDMDRYQFV